MGRKKPYTQIGIRRLNCYRCGTKAVQQWQICSDDNTYRPICNTCDLELNLFVLIFMKFPDWRDKFVSYANNFDEVTLADLGLKLHDRTNSIISPESLDSAIELLSSMKLPTVKQIKVTSRYYQLIKSSESLTILADGDLSAKLMGVSLIVDDSISGDYKIEFNEVT